MSAGRPVRSHSDAPIAANPAMQQKPIRVEICNEKYPLRVAPEDEAYMREVARLVDRRMRSALENHPGHPKLTAAVITALSLAEDLMQERDGREDTEERVRTELSEILDELGNALPPEEGGMEESTSAS